MKPEKKALLIGYLTCFGIASAIALLIFGVKGFFTDDMGVNIQILSDGFFVAGILMTLFAGFMYISSEGALLGIGFIVRSVILTFIPMGRARHEKYSQYRERKLSERKATPVPPYVLVVGVVFLVTGFIFSVIWYTNFYNIPV